MDKINTKALIIGTMMIIVAAANPPSNASILPGINDSISQLVTSSLPASSYYAESPETCGRCHKEELASYRADWHGAANLFGRKDAATCVSCHGEHFIPDITGEEELEELREKDANAFKAYEQATEDKSDKDKAGLMKPESSAAKAVKTNLSTCIQCHPSTAENPNFAAGRASFHFNPSIVAAFKKWKEPGDFLKKQNELWVIVTELVLIGLILFIIAFSLSVVIPHFFRTVIEIRKEQEGEPEAEPEGHIERLSFAFRVQHVILFVTIFVLFLTGIPIKFPEYAFSRPLMVLWGGTESAAIIHRICAVVLVINLIIHLIYMIGTRFGKKMLADMDPLFLIKNIPELKAFLFGDYMKYLWGFKKTKPKMPSFNFLMKSDYWFAIIEVLGVFLPTGLILWGNDWAMSIIPKYGMDIVRQIHGWWALFSMSLVVIVHLYMVHLSPEVFPWSRMFIHGKMSMKELKSNHGEVYDELTGGYKNIDAYMDAPRANKALSEDGGEENQ